MLRTSIEGMLVNVEWESLTSCYKSYRELDPPFVVKVVQPILTIDGGCTVPVEVPAGLHGVVGRMDSDCDLHIFFPELLDVSILLRHAPALQHSNKLRQIL